MPHRYQILPDLNLLYFQYSGHVTREDHRTLTSAFVADPDYKPCLHRLADNSRMTETDLDLPSLIPRRDTLAAALVDEPGPTLWAFFAPTDLGYGMARMEQMLLEDIPSFEIKLFDDLSEAMDFLGLPAGTAQRLGTNDTATTSQIPH